MATTTGTAEPAALSNEEGVRRRDFINIAAVSAAGIGGVATLVPLIAQIRNWRPMTRPTHLWMRRNQMDGTVIVRPSSFSS